MDILKVQQTEQLIRQIIQESQLDILVARYMIKSIYDELDTLYYQSLYKKQIEELQSQDQGEQKDGTSINHSNDNT